MGDEDLQLAAVAMRDRGRTRFCQALRREIPSAERREREPIERLEREVGADLFIGELPGVSAVHVGHSEHTKLIEHLLANATTREPIERAWSELGHHGDAGEEFETRPERSACE